MAAFVEWSFVGLGLYNYGFYDTFVCLSDQHFTKQTFGKIHHLFSEESSI